MKLRRYVCRLFLTILTLTMLGATPLFAQQVENPLQPKECKSSDFSADELAEMAKKAKSNMVKARSLLVRMVNRIEHAYLSESGACHFLYGSISKWWDEATRGQLSFSDEVLKGAKKADEIMHSTQTLTSAKEINGDIKVQSAMGREIDLSGYTDWDITDLRKRIYTSSNEANKVVQWAQNATEGQVMQVSDTDTKNLICSMVKCKKGTMMQNNCDVLIKGSGNSFSCVDTGQYNTSVWPCVDTSAPNYLGNLSCLKPSERDIAYTFSSPNDFKSKVQGGDTQKCIDALEEAGRARGDVNTPDTFIYHRKQAIDALALLSGDVEDCQCQKGTDGVLKVDCPEDSSDEDNMDDDRCKMVGDYEKELSGRCFACQLFANILGAVQKISYNAFDATSSSLISLLTIAFLIYVGYKTLLAIGSPEAIQLNKYLTDLLLQGTKVAITVLILLNPSFLYNKVLSPILVTSVDFGMSLTGVNSEKAMETGKKYAQNFDMTNEYFSGRTAQIMVGAVENFSNGATTMPAIGRALVCNSFQDLPFKYNVYVIPHISMFAEGAMIYVAGITIWLAIGFYMLDCAVELGIVCALMAFFVACWPFKLTSGYTKIGWNMFLNVFFNFVMMGIIVATIIGLSVQSLSVGTTKEELLSMINANDVVGLDERLPLGGLQILMVVVCCAICIKLPAEAGRLANKFASGAQIGDGPGGMGGALGGEAAQLGTNIAVGEFGKQGKLGGLAGLGIKGLKAEAKSVGEHTGATAAMKAGASAVKGALGGKKQGQITNGFKKD